VSNFWEIAEEKLEPYVDQVLSLQEIKDLIPFYRDGNEVEFRTIPKKLKHRLERMDRRLNGEPLRKIDGLMKYKILPKVSHGKVIEDSRVAKKIIKERQKRRKS